MSDDADPKEILLDIHERVKRLEDELIDTGEVHFDLNEGSKAYKVLQCVKNNPGATVSDVQQITGFDDASPQLTRWYRFRLLNREKVNGRYEYTISTRGEIALGDAGEKEETTSDSETRALQPWEDAPISRCKWIAIHLVDKYEGRPETKDLQDEYVEYGFDSKKSLTSQVTRLFKDGYLVRTPWQPYKYDISEKGVGLLDKYGVENIERYKE